MNADLVGSQFRLTLIDGTQIQARLTFGDFVRAESARGVNYAAAFASNDPMASVTLADIAMLSYQAAVRTGQYAGTWAEWELALDGFPEIEDEDEVTAGPFPQVAPAAS